MRTWAGMSGASSGLFNAVVRWRSDALTPIRRRFDEFVRSSTGMPVFTVASCEANSPNTPALLDAAQAGGVPAVVVHHPQGPDTDYSLQATQLRAPATINDLLGALGFESANGRGSVPLTFHRAQPNPAPRPEPLPLPGVEAKSSGSQTSESDPAPENAAKTPLPEPLPPVTAQPPSPGPAPAPAPVPTPVTAPQPDADVPVERSLPGAASLEPGPAPDAPPHDREAGGIDSIDQLLPSSAAPGSRRRHRGLADVIIALAGKGGVSKTTTSYALAQRAADADYGRVLLIDGNRGQGGIRTLLRVPESTPLPSVHDLAYSTTDPADVIIGAEALNDARVQLTPVRFSAVLAPPGDQGNATDTPAVLYQRVLEHARQHFDLIIVDTQTRDGDSSDLFDAVWVPALRNSAWGLALTDSSAESRKNLPVLFDRLSRERVPSSRMLFAATLWSAAFTEQMAEAYTEFFAKSATFAGSSLRDAEFEADLATGHVDVTSPVIRPLLDNVLHTVTGLDSFLPEPDEDTGRRRGRRKGGGRPWWRFSR